MNFCYIVNLDGYRLLHECTYHTREVLKNGIERLVYPRFHDSNGIQTLNLIAEHDIDLDVYKCYLEIENGSNHDVRISVADIGISFHSTQVKLNYFSSDWGSEYSPHEKQIEGEFSYGVVSGRSCKGFIPYAECTADDLVYSVALGWSGNWTCTTFPWEEGYCLLKPETYGLVMGLTDGEFYHDLPAQKKFVTPSIYIASGKSNEETTLQLRRYFKKHLSIVKEEQFSPMPLEYNGWWPYEDTAINEEVYQQNAQIAKELGFTYAMMDAGWFGDNEEGQCWFEKRGDWDRINKDAFPSGMKAMCDKAKAIEILPGLWCEIEAVGKDAKLNQTHEELIAKRDGRSLNYICFGHKPSREWAMATVDKIIGEYGAKWVKFDFNLDPEYGCNRSNHDHGKGDGLYAHYMGYYQFLDQIHEKYPDVVIENCASGGLRGDIEMMSHCHWNHLSDPDFTEFHLQLFWGGLSFLHQSALLHFSWSHVVQGHNENVRNPISEDMPKHKFDYIMRAAMMGVPGFSYKLPEFPQWCLDRLKELGEFYTQTSTEFILKGDAYRLTEQPLSGKKGERFPVFEFVNNKQEALVYGFRLVNAPAQKKVKLKALDESATYIVTYIDSQISVEKTGKHLMEKGINFSDLAEESSEVILIRKK